MKAFNLHQLLASNDLHTTAHLAILEAIDNGEQKLNDIRKGMNISDSATMALLDVLVARGLITRDMDPSDRRRRLSALTHKGTQLLQQFYDL